ncbi:MULTISPECIES: DUF397 domain-containing protein [unclassified Streptomyces]|uniref:DUF397 domain-containing protein n=1 Tax=unclassified Streptomyces TaxID=2593676 RepID=UPI00340C8494
MSLALHWFKSSYSSGEGECLEIAPTPTAIHIRDSKNPPSSGGPTLHVSPATWTAFLTHAHAHPHPHPHATRN